MEIIGHGNTENIAYRVGDHVAVHYPPGRASQGRLESFSVACFGPALLGAFGMAFVGGSLVVVLVRRSQPSDYLVDVDTVLPRR